MVYLSEDAKQIHSSLIDLNKWLYRFTLIDELNILYSQTDNFDTMSMHKIKTDMLLALKQHSYDLM